MDFQNSFALQDPQRIKGYLSSRKEAIIQELAAIQEYKGNLEKECEFWRAREETFKAECTRIMNQTPLEELRPLNSNSSFDMQSKSLIKRAKQMMMHK